MTDHQYLHIFGAIRIVPDVDSIGIAVLRFPKGNMMYIPEMDSDLTIKRIVPFLNEAEYQIDRVTHKEIVDQIIKIGQPAPLPFWVGGSCRFVFGDAEPEDINRNFGSISMEHSVLIDMRKLLKDARNGVFKKREEQWQSDDFQNSFSDIFYEPPIHSRYWVSRYNNALARARQVSPPPHPIDNHLRRVAIDWFSRFSTKTDFARMVAMLGQPSNGVITRERARVTMFAYIVHKIQTENFRQIEKNVRDDFIAELFPAGIYNFYIQRGWPKAPFTYQRNKELLYVLAEEIYAGDKNKDFSKAELMSYLFFQKTDIPFRIHDIVLPLFNAYNDAFNSAVSSSSYIFSNRSYKSEWRDTANEILSLYRNMMQLDGIIHGETRLSKTIINGRFGIYTSQIRKWNKLLDKPKNIAKRR